MEKLYVVQRIFNKGCEDEEYCCSFMNDYELIEYVDMSDCYDYEDYEIWDMSEFGKAKRIHYVGWQPNCLIEFADENGEIVLSGYGTDH